MTARRTAAMCAEAWRQDLAAQDRRAASEVLRESGIQPERVGLLDLVRSTWELAPDGLSPLIALLLPARSEADWMVREAAAHVLGMRGEMRVRQWNPEEVERVPGAAADEKSQSDLAWPGVLATAVRLRPLADASDSLDPVARELFATVLERAVRHPMSQKREDRSAAEFEAF
jgi:hypothetical protein